MNRKRLTLGGTAVIVVWAATAWVVGTQTNGAGAAEIALTPNDQTVVEQGAKVYTENCASCHGEKLEGQPDWRRRGPDGRLPAPPHDPSGHTWHHPDEHLFNLTKYGIAAIIGRPYETDMQPYEGVLNDEEILAALSYIKSTWPPHIQNEHDQINLDAKAKKSQP